MLISNPFHPSCYLVPYFNESTEKVVFWSISPRAPQWVREVRGVECCCFLKNISKHEGNLSLTLIEQNRALLYPMSIWIIFPRFFFIIHFFYLMSKTKDNEINTLVIYPTPETQLNGKWMFFHVWSPKQNIKRDIRQNSR